MWRLLLLAPLLTSCAIGVPASKIRIGTISLDLPQNHEIIKPKIHFISTNEWTFEAESIKSLNDPVVIDRTAAGELAKMREIRKMVEDTFEMGKKAAGVP